MRTTNQHKKYWENRRIDWKESYFNPEHPHRKLIIHFLRDMRFSTVFELGCGAGANLALIKKAFPQSEVGGMDINKDAVYTAKSILPRGVFDIGDFEDIYLEDDSIDVIISDMSLIYTKNIKKVIKEITRTVNNNIIFVELYHKNPIKRFILWLKTGYYAHDYPHLLKKAGFHDIQLYKMSEKDWSGGNPQREYGYVIAATK